MSRIAAIHQPNFFPWLGFFYKMAHSDVFILLDTVDITLGSAKAITHRAKIKTANGPAWLTIPFIKEESRIIRDIRIDYRIPWQEKHLKTLHLAYKKAPYFEEVFSQLEKVYALKPQFLSEFTSNSIYLVKNYLGIQTPIKIASHLEVNSVDRNQRIIDLCRAVAADTYLSGFGGRKYHNEDIFISEGLELKYSDFHHPQYIQFHGDFLAGLSILDALFMFDTKSIKIF